MLMAIQWQEPRCMEKFLGKPHKWRGGESWHLWVLVWLEALLERRPLETYDARFAWAVSHLPLFPGKLEEGFQLPWQHRSKNTSSVGVSHPKQTPYHLTMYVGRLPSSHTNAWYYLCSQDHAYCFRWRVEYVTHSSKERLSTYHSQSQSPASSNLFTEKVQHFLSCSLQCSWVKGLTVYQETR